MGRSPCCEKVGLKKGPWTPEEDQKLLAYIQEHGHGSWRALPTSAGLQRCGKSCRLRWTNYLRPDIKRGKFNLQEEQTIIQLHALLGNRWSAIATHLPKRTDNEIKNYWNTHLKKRLAKMGIDPTTHKSKTNTVLMSIDGQTKHAANLSHMAQWESARLEAEARLARQSELRSNSSTPYLINKSVGNIVPLPPPPRSNLDILKSWNGVSSVVGIGTDLESPTSTLISYSENSTAFIEFVGNSSEEGKENCNAFESLNKLPNFTSGLREMTMPEDITWAPEQIEPNGNFVQRFTDLLRSNNSRDHGISFCELGSDKEGENGSQYFEDNNKNIYWSSILNVVNSSPAESPVFEWEFSS